MNQQQSKSFNRRVSDADERRRAAYHLSAKIRLASRIAKVALNRHSRENAYKLKHSLVCLGLAKFGEFFKLLSYEMDDLLGTVLLVKLADRKAVHIPLKDLTEIQSLVDLSTLPYRVTLPLQKRQHFFNPQTLNFGVPVYC